VQDADQISHLWILLLCEGERHVIREIVQLDPNQAKVNKRGTTLLHIASGARYQEEVELLLSLGADVNVVDFSGDTPLHKAAWNLDAVSCSILLKHNASLNVLDRWGMTPTGRARAGDIWVDDEDRNRTISMLEQAEGSSRNAPEHEQKQLPHLE